MKHKINNLLLNRTDQGIRQKTHIISKWDDYDILHDRVARRLLKDCIEVSGNRSKIRTIKLVDLLNATEEMPWSIYNAGKPISYNHLWRILAKFDIHSTDIRFKSGVFKGFRTEWFLRAWRRVLILLPSQSKIKR